MNDSSLVNEHLLNTEHRSLFLLPRNESLYHFDYEINDIAVYQDERTRELRIYNKKTKSNINIL